MRDSELRILRLHAPLIYTSVPTAGSRPFLPTDAVSEGAEEAALYDPESIVRFDPLDGPRALPALPNPAAAGRSSAAGFPSAPGALPGAGRSRGSGADGAAGSPADADPGVLCLEPGVYGFLQGTADSPEDWLGLVERFARQAWWERLDCEGPYILRRVREEGRWAAQVWRRRAGG